jgi:hypothetical protein
MDKAVPRPWAPRRCSHGPPGSTDARRAEGTCGGPGQRTSETVRKGSSHKKSERAKKILNTVDAIERFVLFAEIAMGLVQLMTYRIQDVRKIQDFRYVRTQRDGYISEATLLYYLRHTFLGSLLSKPESLLRVCHPLN